MFKRKLKIILTAIISFCFLLTFTFMASCGGPPSTEETEPAEEAEEEEEEEAEEEGVSEEEVAEEEEEVIYEIVFMSNHGSPTSIYSCMPDGSDIKLIYDSGFDEYGPCWNTDHTEIVFPSNKDGDGIFDLYVYDVATGEVSRLTDREGDDWYPAYGPDGSVVFGGSVGSHEEGNFEIFTVGSEVKQLTDNPAWDVAPRYSPDGKTIIFTSDRDGYPKLYTMDTEGNNIAQVTNSGEWTDWLPAISPDGKNIAFNSDRSGDFDVWVMPVDNPDEATNLTNNPANDLGSSWSPDGSMILFISDRDEDEEWVFDIFTMDADGGNQTNITSDLKGTSQESGNW